VGHRDDRAGHRQSDLAGMKTTAKQVRGRHALRPQRRQDVHHRRRPRRPGHRVRAHRSPVGGEPPQGHLAPRRRHQGPRVCRGSQARQARTQGLRHRRAVLHRRARAGRGPARRGGQGLLLPRRATCRRSGSASPLAPTRRRPRRSEFTQDYTQRVVFGQPVAAFQNTKFELAACKAKVDAAQAVVDRGIEALDAGELTPPRRPRPSSSAPRSRPTSSTAACSCTVAMGS
jgi:hypothetical protein